ncbi:MAG: alkyl hydroperoxide reductase [Myxococcales bacterium]|nr:alkyl hydroperoxide reductase [Myxococcales bacterium]
MSIEQLKGRLPEHAKDLRLNLGVIAASTALTPAQAWGIAITCAITARNREVVDAIEAEAAAHLPAEAITAARGAASIMGMNNVYYRFLHYMGSASEYGHMPARLRMQLIGNPGIEKLDFELECLAASAITGCEMCVRSHEKVIRERGGTKEMVQDAVRIAAVLHAAAVTLDGQ